jgi:hypothetical protein
MKIGPALAADLGILTAALDEPGANVLHSLHQLGVDARAAVPTYLGLSVTVEGSDPPFTFTTVEDGAADDVRTSLRLTLPGVSDGRASPSVALTLYAGTPGTFVDLTADLPGRTPGHICERRRSSIRPSGSSSAAATPRGKLTENWTPKLIARAPIDTPPPNSSSTRSPPRTRPTPSAPTRSPTSAECVRHVKPRSAVAPTPSAGNTPRSCG